MIKNIVKRAFISLILLIGTGSALAEDIDIFSQNTAATAAAPNVLIIMDNTSNWSTQFSYEMAALKAVFASLASLPAINIGIMEQTAGSDDGGYMRFAVRNVGGTSSAAVTNRTALGNIIQEITDRGGNSSIEKANNPTYAQTYNEAYLYLKGLAPRVGLNDSKRDCGSSNTTNNPYASAIGSGYAYTSCGTSGVTYISPDNSAAVCQKTFIIYLSNGPISNNDNSPGLSLLTGVGGDTSVISVTPNGESASNYADEWSRFMHKNMGVVSYAINVNPASTGQGPAHTAMMKSIAKVGGGRYCESSSQAGVQSCLSTFFNEILAVNSVFASTTLPLSADNSGAYLNQLYVGMFRPDGNSKPRWYGNLKQYQFTYSTSTNSLTVVDSAGTQATSASTGFAQPDAVSFWTSKDTTSAPDAPVATSTSATTGSTGGFWAFDSKGSGASYDSPDGEWVEKGGAAQQLRLAYLGYGGKGSIGDTNGSSARQVYTCTGTCLTTSGTPLSTTPFDSTNTAITDVALGLASASTVTGFASDSAISATAVVGKTTTVTSTAKSGSKAVAAVPIGHGFVVDDVIAVTGSTYSGYNIASSTVTAVTSNSITYSPNSTSNSPATDGTITASGTTVTVTTSSMQSYAIGDTVTVTGATPSALNIISAVVSAPSTTEFTYSLSAAQSYATTSMSVARNRATATTSAAHGLSVNDTVTVAGSTPAGYNGTVTVTAVPSATTFTYSYTSSAPLANGSSGTVTKSSGGAATLIKWIRGQDTQNENSFQVNSQNTDVRASIHGDVLHSRPVVLNYASSGTDNLYVFYGGNDGVFRAIKGGQAATDGKEQWAFIPQDFFGKFLRPYNNTPLVLYPSTGIVTATSKPRDYSFDGPVGSYIERNTSGTVTKAYLYISVRRGGRFIYALDVTTPTAPKFLWKISSSDAGFAELGQTWSQPNVVKIHANTNPVLIFGAGYDAASEDTESPVATADMMGRGVFVVDAFTGALVWSAGNSGNNPNLSVSGMNFSIAGDVLPLDRTFDGYVDRVYAADVGGNVWRFDIDDANKSNWTVWKIATVGDRSTTATSRKFLFGMDVVFGDVFDAILIGSGDREHPLSTNTASSVTNRVYMFKDPNTSVTGAALGILDTSAGASAGLFDATNSNAVPANATGWYITLATGEKVINAPLVAGGSVLFGTNQPDTSSNSCTGNLGIARRYNVGYLLGSAGSFTDSSGAATRSEVAVGGGFLPSPVAGVVEIGGKKISFSTDNPLNPGGSEIVNITVPTKRYRTYWFEKLE